MVSRINEKQLIMAVIWALMMIGLLYLITQVITPSQKCLNHRIEQATRPAWVQYIPMSNGHLMPIVNPETTYDKEVCIEWEEDGTK